MKYRVIHGAEGMSHFRRIQDSGDWVEMSEAEAKAAGIWIDPRTSTQGARDVLATAEQLASRDKGYYDPRQASGAFVSDRLTFHCVRCGARLGGASDYEERELYFSARTRRWSIRPADLKCQTCYGPLEPFGVDLSLIATRLERARHAGLVEKLKIGDMPYVK